MKNNFEETKKIAETLFLAHSGNAMICLSADHQYTVIDFNSEAETLLNILKQDIVGKNLFSTCVENGIYLPFSEHDLSEKTINIQKFIGAFMTLSHQIKKFVQWKFVSLNSSEKHDHFLLIIMRDVSELINDNSEIYLRNVVENLPEYIYWKDCDLVYKGCNKHVAEYLKLKSPEEIIGKTDHDFNWSEERIAELYEIDCKIIKEKQTISIEEEIPNSDGSTRAMLTSKSPLICKLGKVVGVLGVSTDITEQKKTEIELIKAKEEAEESNRIKTLFMENMSHDFRTPMNGIFGIAQLLETHKDEFPDEINELVSLQKKSILRLNKLVSSILDYNKIKAGKVEIERNDLNLLEIIESVVHNLSYHLKNKPVDIQINYPPDMPRNFISDSYCVTSVILNLMNNAVKFTKEGHVTIAVKIVSQNGKNALIEIAIADTGRGIPPDQLTQIFDRFHRLEMSNTELTEGHGVGLSVVKELLDKLNGNIQVKSELEKGSTFTLQLPFEVLEMPFFISTWKKKHPNVRVLLGSDKDSNTIGNQLGEKTITIVRSKEIINALLSAAHAEEPYHIIIVDEDIQMLNAFDFIQTVLSIKEIPPLLWLLSSKPQDKEWFDRARIAGYFDFIIKPILPTELDEKLTAAWEHWSQRN